MTRSLLALSVLTLAACGGDGGGNGGAGGGGGNGDDIQPVTIMLEEMNNSGKTGTAELQPATLSTQIAIALEPAQGDNETIHIHSGTCDSPGEEVVHDVGFTSTGLAQGQVFVSLTDLTTGEFVLDIHSATDPDQVIMCGAIPER